MKNILFFGDSNTWGYQGDDTMHRLPFEKRFIGVVQQAFPTCNIISEGYPGRTVCFDDPTDDNCSGMTALPIVLRSHDPIDLIIVMLGTNDVKSIFHTDLPTMQIAMERLVQVIQSPDRWSVTMQTPKILLISPPSLGDIGHSSHFYEVFNDRSCDLIRRLPQAYAAVAAQYGCYFLDASSIVASGCSDQVHLTADEHAALGALLVAKLREIG